MPQIGRPQSQQEKRFQQVSMAPRNVAKGDELSSADKQKLFNKLTGYKEQSIYKTQKDHNKMGKNEFLKLLTYQLQNQDPMNPVDQHKFAAELAQFSQLEQLSNLNSKFDGMNKSANMKDRFYAASFLGKKVVTSGASIKVKTDGAPADVMFKLNGAAKDVMVRIFDAKGNMVGQMEHQNLYPGNHQFKWDGVTLDGAPAQAGDYMVQVLAYDEAYQPVQSELNAVGLVESVTFEDGEAVLVVDGKKVFLRDVKSFHIAQKDLMQENKMKQEFAQKAKTPPAQAINKFEGQRSVYD